MTDPLRKAAEQALEALEDIAEKTPTTHVRAGKAMIGGKEHVALWFDDSSDPIQQADYINQTKPEKMLAMIKALRQALAQPEQEPVAYYYEKSPGKRGVSLYKETEEWQPLYTAPPKQWVGLTDEEFKFIASKYSLPTQTGMEYFKDELETKLKEKNNG
jgi:hypothetical protein